MNEQIQQRIKELTLERNAIQINHGALVQENNRLNQEFQEQAVKNQTRYAQITGGITELQQLMKDTNHDNRISTPSISDRFADVCARLQPEGG